MAKEADFSQFEAFCEKYNDSMKYFDDFMRKFLAEMAQRLLAKAKPRTPVGTPESTGVPGYIGGSLRSAWQIGEITKVGGAFQIEILNGMEYASFVEFGHRTVSGGWVDGRFMLTISEDEIRKQMPLRFEKAFNQWCLERGLI